jgi:hypothetical protein
MTQALCNKLEPDDVEVVEQALHDEYNLALRDVIELMQNVPAAPSDRGVVSWCIKAIKGLPKAKAGF